MKLAAIILAVVLVGALAHAVTVTSPEHAWRMALCAACGILIGVLGTLAHVCKGE